VPGWETTAALVDHAVALDEDVGLDVSSVSDGTAGGVLAATAAGVLVSEVDADTAVLAAGGARVGAGHIRVRRRVIRVGHVHIGGFIFSFISLQVSSDGFQIFTGLDHVHVFGVDGNAIVLVDSVGFIGILAIWQFSSHKGDEKKTLH
jgi:hypothetical protein